MAYSADTPIPKTNGIVLVEVAKLLGTNIKDVARLCTSGKINIWAKYKPFSLYLTDGSYNSNIGNQGVLFYDSQDVEVRKNANYGLAVTGNSPMYYWTFNKPRLGKADPARIEDFWGYLHNAKAPYHIQIHITGVSTAIDLENKDTAEVYVLKGFTSSAEDKVEFQALPNTHNDGEFVLTDLMGNDSGAYNYFILVLENITSNGNNAVTTYHLYNMTAPTGSPTIRACSINLPMTKEGVYNAAVVLNTSAVTDGESPTLSSFTPYPLLAKNNKFKINLKQKTVWDESLTNWISVKAYCIDAGDVVVNNTTFHVKKITKMTVQGSVTFSTKYDRTFYLYLSYEIGAVQNSETYYPIRITHTKTASEISTSSGGGIGGSDVLVQHTKGTTTTFSKDVTLSTDIYVCCMDGHELHPHIAVNAHLGGHVTDSPTSSNDVGESTDKYTSTITYNSLTNS